MLMRNSEHRKELISEIKSLAQSQGLNTVFTTFLEITANSLAAQTDPERAAKCRKARTAISGDGVDYDAGTFIVICADVGVAVLDCP